MHKFAAISAKFTISTANLLAVLLPFERLYAVAFPILYRRKASLSRSLILVGCVVFYTVTLSLSSLAGSRWRRTALTIPFVALIVVNIALVFAVRWQKRKTQCLLEGLDGSPKPTTSESRRREREKTLAVTVCRLFCDVFVPLSHLRIHRSLFFPIMENRIDILLVKDFSFPLSI